LEEAFQYLVRFAMEAYRLVEKRVELNSITSVRDEDCWADVAGEMKRK
jgi:hypothetical protein